MRPLLQALAQGLELGLEEPLPPAPFVYTTAIRCDAGLTRSLAGITLLAREIGFARDAETVYSADGRSATYHAQHGDRAVALAVEVCPSRQTVAIAVSGHNNSEAFELFQQADQQLFGLC